MTLRLPGPVASAFIAAYPGNAEKWEAAAVALEGLLTEIRESTPIEIHDITAREKDFESLVEKVVRKGYGRPKSQVTDLAAGRVITYFATDVDPMVIALRTALIVDDRRSPDRRMALDLGEFGYRSVHLVARATDAQCTRYPALRGLWFEVQVRSLLEHAWAEVDHGIRYKSGVTLSPDQNRRFSALAANLELIDQAFVDLRRKELESISEIADRYATGLDQDEALDVGRLAGFMIANYPDRPGWRRDKPPLATTRTVALRLMLGLKLVGANTARALRLLMNDPSVANRSADFAAAKGLAPDELPHRAQILIAIATRDTQVVEALFPLEARDLSSTA